MLEKHNNLGCESEDGQPRELVELAVALAAGSDADS